MSAIYSPEGAFLGSMRKKRIETLAQAYRNELGDLPQAIAKLIARYKDGSISGKHTIAYKKCYTAPPSLTTALISALGATTGLFATPFDFNPKMKHYSAPFADDGGFGAHPDAFSFIWQGSCYCHPEPSDAQMLTLRWALACASIQTEPLLITLLLSERPKSAFTNLLSHPSVLHLTTVQDIAFLNPVGMLHPILLSYNLASTSGSTSRRCSCPSLFNAGRAFAYMLWYGGLPEYNTPYVMTAAKGSLVSHWLRAGQKTALQFTCQELHSAGARRVLVSLSRSNRQALIPIFADRNLGGVPPENILTSGTGRQAHWGLSFHRMRVCIPINHLQSPIVLVMVSMRTGQSRLDWF